jgi:hypothetical protein
MPETTPSQKHPVLRNDYAIGTSITFELYKIVKDMIKMRRTGYVAIGKSQVGKSRAIAHIIRRLREEFGDKIAILYHSCHSYKPAGPHLTQFFEDLLESFGHDFSAEGKISNKKTRIINYIKSCGMRSEDKIVFLFLDEAQNMHSSRYMFLVDVFNELNPPEGDKVTLLTLSVGEKQLEYNRDQLIRGYKIKIIARFMPRVFHIYGLRSSADMDLCLHEYDNKTEYPEGSGCSFTRYFFPIAFGNSFRLQNEAGKLWETFMAVKDTYKITGKNEIIMVYFVKTIHYVFLNYSGLDAIDFTISKKMWEKAIIESDYPLYSALIDAEGGDDKSEQPS